jgi:hypothetical protein
MTEIQWPHMTDPSHPALRFAPVSNDGYTLLYRADGSTRLHNGAYSHHPHVVFHDGKLFVMWSNHLRDEDCPGQRVYLRFSSDLGRSWQPDPVGEPIELFPSLDDWKFEEDVVSGDNLAGTANGFAIIHGGELYAVNEVLPSIRMQDRGFGRLVRRIYNDGSLGEVFWIEKNPPAGPPGFPSYPGANDPSFAPRAALIKAYLEDPSRLHLPTWDFKGPRNTSTELEPSLPGSPLDGHRLCEPTTSFRLPDGRLAMFWRDLGLRGQPSFRLYLSCSCDGGRRWTVPVQTAFPDACSRPCASNLPDGSVYVVNNPCHGGSRMLLTISVARDGACFSSCRAIRWQETAPRFAGMYKGAGYAYPHACVAGEMLFVVYSINKEDIEICHIPISGLAG